MALAKKCDRCGQYYDHYPLGNEPGIYNAIRRARVDFDGKLLRESNHIDLCPKCMDDLFRFLHHVETEEPNAKEAAEDFVKEKMQKEEDNWLERAAKEED